MLNAIAKFIDRLRPTPRFEAEMDAEIRHHIEAHTDRLIAGGMDPAAAARKAKLDFGAREHYRDEVRQTRWLWFLEELLRDVRFGIRSLRRAPGLTVTIILTLALGIGANTAVFSVVNGILIRPLPFEEPDRLFHLLQYGPTFSYFERDQMGSRQPEVSFYGAREQLNTFAGVTGIWRSNVQLIGVQRSEKLSVGFTAPNFCQVLGVRPQMGRCLTETDDQQATGVVLLRDELWRRQFGGDPKILGRTITLRGVLGERSGDDPNFRGNRNFTVVGILPREFDLDLEFDLLLPESLRPVSSISVLNRPQLEIGRLRDGVSPEAAHTEMVAVQKQLRPDQYEGTRLGSTILLLPMMEYGIGASLPRQLWILMGVVSLLLLIACTNVANLLLSRGAARQRELSVRLAVGASRPRIIRQLLTESVLLTLTGGAAGILVAIVGLRWILAIFGNELPRVESIHLDLRVLAYTAGVSMLAGLLLGVVPAIRLSRTDLSETMRSGGAGSAGGQNQQRWMSGLLASQVALCLVAVIAAGLLIHTVIRLRNVDLGFEPQGLMLARLDLPFDVAGSRTFLDQTVQRVRLVPGVSSVAVARYVPTENTFWVAEFRRPGSADRYGEDLDRRANLVEVSPGYFETLRIPMLQGRDFLPGDWNRTGALPMIASQGLVDKYWPGQNPVGQGFGVLVAGESEERMAEIVGIAGDVHQFGAREQQTDVLYAPYGFQPIQQATLLVRGTDGRTAPVAAVSAAIRDVDGDQTLNNSGSFITYAERGYVSELQLMTLLSWFAGLALILTAVGVAGQVAYAVGRRTPEIAIRVSCGASPATILRLFLASSLWPVLAGVGIGAVAALGLTTYAESQLFEIKPSDPETYLIAALVLTGIAVFASLIAASRATRVDPAQVLRQE